MVFSYKIELTFLCKLERFPAAGEFTCLPGGGLILLLIETPWLGGWNLQVNFPDVNVVSVRGVNFSRVSEIGRGKVYFSETTNAPP